jgi:hypothetical protein
MIHGRPRYTPHPGRPHRYDLNDGTGWRCACGKPLDEAAVKRGRNNRSRGNKAELDAARIVNGRKVGPLGLPWDIEMAGYARLQVRKYQRPESLRKISAELDRIGLSPSGEMPGYIWIEPGRGSRRLIVFRLPDFADRHGVPDDEGEAA